MAWEYPEQIPKIGGFLISPMSPETSGGSYAPELILSRAIELPYKLRALWQNLRDRRKP
jgi:hypothetical protein